LVARKGSRVLWGGGGGETTLEPDEARHGTVRRLQITLNTSPPAVRTHPMGMAVIGGASTLLY
jgi:hypothetical protein